MAAARGPIEQHEWMAKIEQVGLVAAITYYRNVFEATASELERWSWGQDSAILYDFGGDPKSIRDMACYYRDEARRQQHGSYDETDQAKRLYVDLLVSQINNCLAVYSKQPLPASAPDAKPAPARPEAGGGSGGGGAAAGAEGASMETSAIIAELKEMKQSRKINDVLDGKARIVLNNETNGFESRDLPGGTEGILVKARAALLEGYRSVLSSKRENTLRDGWSRWPEPCHKAEALIEGFANLAPGAADMLYMHSSEFSNLCENSRHPLHFLFGADFLQPLRDVFEGKRPMIDTNAVKNISLQIAKNIFFEHAVLKQESFEIKSKFFSEALTITLDDLTKKHDVVVRKIAIEAHFQNLALQISNGSDAEKDAMLQYLNSLHQKFVRGEDCDFFQTVAGLKDGMKRHKPAAAPEVAPPVAPPVSPVSDAGAASAAAAGPVARRSGHGDTPPARVAPPSPVESARAPAGAGGGSGGGASKAALSVWIDRGPTVNELELVALAHFKELKKRDNATKIQPLKKLWEADYPDVNFDRIAEDEIVDYLINKQSPSYTPSDVRERSTPITREEYLDKLDQRRRRLEELFAEEVQKYQSLRDSLARELDPTDRDLATMKANNAGDESVRKVIVALAYSRFLEEKFGFPHIEWTEERVRNDLKINDDKDYHPYKTAGLAYIRYLEKQKIAAAGASVDVSVKPAPAHPEAGGGSGDGAAESKSSSAPEEKTTAADLEKWLREEARVAAKARLAGARETKAGAIHEGSARMEGTSWYSDRSIRYYAESRGVRVLPRDHHTGLFVSHAGPTELQYLHYSTFDSGKSTLFEQMRKGEIKGPVFIPVNVTGGHWTGLVIIPAKDGLPAQAYYFDPLGQTNHTEAVRRLLGELEAAGLTVHDWSTKVQADGVSCGPYTCAFMTNVKKQLEGGNSLIREACIPKAGEGPELRRMQRAAIEERFFQLLEGSSSMPLGEKLTRLQAHFQETLGLDVPSTATLSKMVNVMAQLGVPPDTIHRWEAELKRLETLPIGVSGSGEDRVFLAGMKDLYGKISPHISSALTHRATASTSGSAPAAEAKKNPKMTDEQAAVKLQSIWRGKKARGEAFKLAFADVVGALLTHIKEKNESGKVLIKRTAGAAPGKFNISFPVASTPGAASPSSYTKAVTVDIAPSSTSTAITVEPGATDEIAIKGYQEAFELWKATQKAPMAEGEKINMPITGVRVTAGNEQADLDNMARALVQFLEEHPKVHISSLPADENGKKLAGALSDAGLGARITSQALTEIGRAVAVPVSEVAIVAREKASVAGTPTPGAAARTLTPVGSVREHDSVLDID